MRRAVFQQRQDLELPTGAIAKPFPYRTWADEEFKRREETDTNGEAGENSGYGSRRRSSSVIEVQPPAKRLKGVEEKKREKPLNDR